MKLKDIFKKPVDRYIEGVIKADDLASLKLEVEEYELTNEISRRLSAFFDAYNNYQGANGAWISGFFGSGKSHLLKMLALLLENQVIDGKPTLEYFLPKCDDDAMFQGEMRKAVSIPSKSILFNIDQKADTINKTETDALLSVFLKVFNEMCGYYGKHGYIAQFERDLDERGQLQDFRDTYKKISGKAWEQGRERVILEKTNIAEAYARISGNAAEDNINIIDHYRIDFKVSIEDFANMVKDYILKQDTGFRLNFFVDEAGQYIADNVKLMTNLQTIAESLATKCRGQSFIIVTAQDDIEKVLGEMNRKEDADFSKIQDRFQTRLKLTSANVDDVIQKRLLRKNTLGETQLAPLYATHRNNFGTLFEFTDGSISYRNYKDQKHFLNSYPFIPYQFTLFQSAIENLSKHSAFEGKHRSVGERSMLSVFQQVAVHIADKSIGELATFDLMFEGIRNTLKAQIQTSIRTAENNLEDAFAIRVLKALFLVKYVKEFKATPRNIRVLMHHHFDLDFADLKQKIDAALSLLEQQTYIQRNGDIYEYLTDEEKDVEQEIKNTEVDSGEVASALEDILFSYVIQDRKIRYDVTGQDFPFSKKLDDRLSGREQELAIHFITPFYEHHENVSILQANSLGRAELMIVLPPDVRLVGDLLMYKKTEKYIRLNQAAQMETIQRILSVKGIQNQQRIKDIRERIKELVGKARLFVSGDEIQVNGEEPRTRIYKGFTELIVKTYPNLRMIQGITYKEEDIGKYLAMTKGSLFAAEPADISEAEQELLAFIQSNSRTGIRTTMKGLENKFSTKPYGWYLAAIQCILAKLCGRGKIEARSDANLLENDALERALKNTHGFPNIILEPQIEFTPSEVRHLKDFYNEFFDHPPYSSEARALGKETGEAFRSLLTDMESLAAQTSRYPFLSTIREPIQLIQELIGKPYAFFLTDLNPYKDRLFDIKENKMDPIRRFMSGGSKGIYDEASEFIRRQEPNLIGLKDDKPDCLKAILEDEDCYRGDQMREAKELTEALRTQLDALVSSEREKALRRVDELQERLISMPEHALLSGEKQSDLAEEFDYFRRDLQQQSLIAVIRDLLHQFEERQFNRMLTDIANLVYAHEQGGGNNIGEARVEYVSKNRLRVSFDKAYLASEADVDEYLRALRDALLEEIEQGKRIQI